jgi:soluble lytic murein transglycosylase-like protein
MIKQVSAAVVAATLISTPTFADGAHGFVVAAANEYNVPVDLALRVAHYETHVQCGLIGSHGERGPMQIMLRTGRGIGFGDIRHASCATQTRAGVKFLSMCYRGAHGNRFRAAACHNAGLGSLKWKNLPWSARQYARDVLR